MTNKNLRYWCNSFQIIKSVCVCICKNFLYFWNTFFQSVTFLTLGVRTCKRFTTVRLGLRLRVSSLEIPVLLVRTTTGDSLWYIGQVRHSVFTDSSDLQWALYQHNKHRVIRNHPLDYISVATLGTTSKTRNLNRRYVIAPNRNSLSDSCHYELCTYWLNVLLFADKISVLSLTQWSWTPRIPSLHYTSVIGTFGRYVSVICWYLL